MIARVLLLATLVFLSPAHADLLLTGAGIAPGGGTPPFTPAGLTFLPYISLGATSALGVTNSKTLTYSFWQKGTYDNTNPTTMQGISFFGNLATHCEVTGGTAPGLCGSPDNSSGRFQLNFNNATGVTNATDAVKFQGQAGSNGLWHHYLIGIDTANSVSALYVDGVNSGTTANPLPANEVPDLNNSGGFRLGGFITSAASPVMMEQAEVAVAEASIVCTGVGTPATMNGITVTCAAANTIPPEVLSKFISSGLPVDLGTGCANPFGGRQAEICLRNGSQANTGSATTAFATMVQTATYGAVFASPYGPGGIPAHQATMKWIQAKNNATVTSLTMTTSAGSMPIAVGDLIVIWAGISNSSGSTNYALTCPSGFTQVGPVNDTVQSVNSEMCYKILVGGDTGGAYIISWNTGGGVRTHDWVMADYTNVASVDQTGSRYNGTGAVTTHPTPAGLTTTSGNETVVSALVDWDSASNAPWSFPGTGVGRYRLPDVGSPLQMMFADEYAVANGANPQRNFTSATASQSSTFTITLVPN